LKEDYIYLIENTIGDTTRYKIGFTSNIERRLKEITTSNPGSLNVLEKFKTKWNRKVETIIHKRYSNKNVKNEWFDLSDSDVKKFIYHCQKIESNLDFLYENNNNFFL